MLVPHSDQVCYWRFSTDCAVRSNVCLRAASVAFRGSCLSSASHYATTIRGARPVASFGHRRPNTKLSYRTSLRTSLTPPKTQTVAPSPILATAQEKSHSLATNTGDPNMIVSPLRHRRSTSVSGSSERTSARGSNPASSQRRLVRS